MNAIARQIQIDMITGTPNEIVTWFNDLWSKLNITETDVYHTDGGEIIYYHITNGEEQCVFYQDDKKERFWCSYNLYWTILESKFNLKHEDIQSVTKLLAENALKSNVATPLLSLLNDIEIFI